jgi:RNA polymerase sigma-70 factor (ECF subfamily)
LPVNTRDPDTFQRLAEPYRRELQLHCYRMVGSFHDAEDLVQEKFLRAWRALDHYHERDSMRGWLYRIATNACLSALSRRRVRRRVLPDSHGPPSERVPDGRPATEIAWLEPYPDRYLEGVADTELGPEARYEAHEAVQLAFVAAIQHLPPRQRAVLLIRDVLGWSASETARLLDASDAGVNSALQRARATLASRFPAGRPPGAPPTGDERQRSLLERYVRAWEDADLDGFVSLLREDVVLNMPPWREWYRGRAAVAAFFSWAWQASAARSMLVPTAANRQPAFAQYVGSGSTYQAYAIWLLDTDGDTVAALTGFIDPGAFADFRLPMLRLKQLRTSGSNAGLASTLDGRCVRSAMAS